MPRAHLKNTSHCARPKRQRPSSSALGGTGAKGHYLDMTQGQLLRSELAAVMESKGTRGVILMTDACSTPGDYRKDGPTGSGAPPEVDHWTAFKSLLDGTSGTVDITAASGTSRAFVDPEEGAIFTAAVLEVISKPFAELDINAKRNVRLLLSFWDPASSRITGQPGVAFEDTKVVPIAQKEVTGNDNNPWELFIADRALVAPRDAKGVEIPLRVQLTIFDGNNFLYNQAWPLAGRTDGLAPRQ